MFASQSGQQPAAGANEDINAQAHHGKMGARKPAPILVYQNVPLESRARPDITPSDPKWQEMLAYFNTIMSTPGVTLDSILKDHFTPARAAQKDDTELFKRTLETRFKGVLPTLPMKMTMLYFGLHVAPMKLGRNQYVTAGDLDEPMEDVAIERDPLAFLDDYEERTYGLPPKEVKYIRLGSDTHSQWEGSESLSLRGGFLEEDDMESVASESQCDEDMASQPGDGAAMEPSLRGGSSAAKSFRLHSRQGQADIAGGLEGLTDGINQLLSLGHSQRKVKLVFSIRSPANGYAEMEAEVESPLTVEAAYENAALGQLVSYMEGVENWGKVFVRTGSDVAPEGFEPRPLDGGLATISIWDEDDLERVGYLRTATRPNLSHSVTDYAPGYQQTLKALIGSHHQYVTFPNVAGPDGPVAVYSCEDLPQQLISDTATQTYCNIKASVTKIDENIVPIILPDSQHLRSSKNYIEIFRQDIGDVQALNKVVEFALSRQPRGRKLPTALYVHFPGENFQKGNEPDVVVDLVGGRPTQASQQLWGVAVGASKYDHEGGFSIVVQPWYETYLLSVPQSMQKKANQKPTEARLHEFNITLFRLQVQTSLYPGDYDPDNKEHTIIVEDDIRSYRHVITSESTEQDWQRIRGRLMSQNIEITLRKGDRELRWDADENSYWGPCYNRTHYKHLNMTGLSDPSNLGTSSNVSMKSGNMGSVGTIKTFGTSRSQEVADARYKTYSSRLNDFMEMKGSDHSMRDLTMWDTPSIFTNPMKPVMPLHAPPLESVIRTGPDVPAITMGMRTATEMARLEREVHTLRAQLLDRIRECPYNDCDRRFSYMDTHGFERHIKYEHKILQCALCTAFKISSGEDIDIDPSLMYMNRDQILVHIAEEHAGHLQAFIQPPDGGHQGSQGSRTWANATPEQKQKVRMVLFPFCGICGRQETKLNDAEDILHHHLHCRGNSKDGLRNLKPGPFCKACGAQSVLTSHGRRCVNKSCGTHDPEAVCDTVCCRNCGFDLSGCSQMYRAKHEHFCRPLIGHTSANGQRFCSFCGSYVEDLDAEDKEKHIWECRERPQPRPQKCPICDTPGSQSSLLLYTPQEVRQHLETFHDASSHCPWCEVHMLSDKTGLEWADDLKHYHFADHMGQVSPFVRAEDGEGEGHIAGARCPYFNECGVQTTDMTGDQWNRHMEKSHGDHAFYPNGMPNPSQTAPPKGYGNGKGLEFYRHKHGKPPATTATTAAAGSSSSSNNKKRPHTSYAAPSTASSSTTSGPAHSSSGGPSHSTSRDSSQKRGTSGATSGATSNATNDDDEGSEPSLENSYGKRRKVSFEVEEYEEPTTYTGLAGNLGGVQAEAEPEPEEEEYMDTQQDSDHQGHEQDLVEDPDTEMEMAPPSFSLPPQKKQTQPPKSPRGVTKKTTQSQPTAKGKQSMQPPPPRFSPARDMAAAPTGRIATSMKSPKAPKATIATTPAPSKPTTAAGAAVAEAATRPYGVGDDGEWGYPWTTKGPKSPLKKGPPPKSPAKKNSALAKPSSTATTATTTTEPAYASPTAATKKKAVEEHFAKLAGRESLEEASARDGYEYADPVAAKKALDEQFAAFKAREEAAAHSAGAPGTLTYEDDELPIVEEGDGEHQQVGLQGQSLTYGRPITPPLFPPPSAHNKVHEPLHIGPRGPGEPYIIKVTKRDPQQHTQTTTTAAAVVTSIEEEVPAANTNTTRSGRRPRPTAAKLASEAEAATAAATAAATGTGTRASSRRQTPAKSPVKTTRAASRSAAQIEEVEEPKSATSTARPRAPSPAKRGRPRK
ncbi:hypothetical protein PG984_010459 [Apiospora sp. TS-2023a]